MILLIPILIIPAWSISRAILNEDLKLFGTITNEGGSQLLWSNHMAQLESGEGLYDSIELGKGSHDSKGNFGEIEKNYFNLSDNSKTSHLIKILKQEITDNPNYYLVFVEELSRNEWYKDELSRIWLPNIDKPQGIVDLYFGSNQNLRSTQAIYLFQRILVSKYGIKESDSLLRSAALESLIMNPGLLRYYFNIFVGHVGIDSINYNLVKPNFGVGIPYLVIPFNVVDCARNGMNDTQFSEYKFLYPRVITSEIENFISYDRSIFRIILGISILLLSLGFFLSKKNRNEFNFVLLVTEIFILFTFTVGMVKAGSRYDVISGAVGIIIVGRALIIVTNKLKEVISIKNRN
jgi:hypothetical protein